MSRKRDKPYPSHNFPNSLPKRRRPLPPPPPAADDDGGEERPSKRSSPPPAVVVIGLSPNCSVLDLKSRFEIYGSISRIRIDRDGVGYITFRSKDSAESAIAAALDHSFGITFDSKRVQVLWASDPLCRWREGVGFDGNKDNGSSSKLLRAEAPLSRHGRGQATQVFDEFRIGIASYLNNAYLAILPIIDLPKERQVSRRPRSQR